MHSTCMNKMVNKINSTSCIHFLECHDHVPSEYYELQDLLHNQKLNYMYFHKWGSLQVDMKSLEKMVDLQLKKVQEEYSPKLFLISQFQLQNLQNWKSCLLLNKLLNLISPALLSSLKFELDTKNNNQPKNTLWSLEWEYGQIWKQKWQIHWK